MKDKPILFSGPMVRAILEDRKTQTRRVIKPQPTKNDIACIDIELLDTDGLYRTWLSNPDGGIDQDYNPEIWKSPYQVGQHLWVRETWQYAQAGINIIYRADETWGDLRHLIVDYKWRPSIFMPRKFSRITLEVTEVRCERLQEIDEIDAIHEGVHVDALHELKSYSYPNKKHFEYLWDSINGKKYPWSSNPWVWVISFKRIKP